MSQLCNLFTLQIYQSMEAVLPKSPFVVFESCHEKEKHILKASERLEFQF